MEKGIDPEMRFICYRCSAELFVEEYSVYQGRCVVVPCAKCLRKAEARGCEAGLKYGKTSKDEED